MTEGYVLAIDQGTTGSTVLVFNREGSIRGRAYSEFTQYYPKPGWVEHDAEELWSVTLGVIKSALENAGANPKDVRGIGLNGVGPNAVNLRDTALLSYF